MSFEIPICENPSFQIISQEEPQEALLTSEDIAIFQQEGYLIIPKVFVKEVEELQTSYANMLQEILEEINRPAYPFSEKTQVTYLKGAQVVFKKEDPSKQPSILRVVGCGSIDQKSLELSRSPKLLQAFSELLNSQELEQLICQAHFKLPGDNVSFARHQDIKYRKEFDPEWNDINGPCSYAIAIIPVDPMGQNNGGLSIEPRSHLNPSEESVWIEAAPGDLLLMHPYVWHESGPNMSNESRRTLLTGFCAYGANHKNYPGNCTNMVIDTNPNPFSPIKEAPWHQKDDHSFFKGNDSFIIH